MSRTLRLLLTAALVAGPAAAKPLAGSDSFQNWVVTESVNLAANALTAVVDPPTFAQLGVAGAEIPIGPAWMAADRSRPSVRRASVESHRPRIARRHRPAPRGSDGDPPQ